MSEAKPKTERFWAILELMGHVRLAGEVSEELRFGVVMGRIDIPTGEETSFTTQYFGGSSVYRLTPTTEEIARSIAKSNQPTPVHAWELPRLAPGREQSVDFDETNDDQDENHAEAYL